MADWRPMTELEARGISYLGFITFPIASSTKRFARSLRHQADGVPRRITNKQALALWALLWRFRRQVAAKDIVEHAKRMSVPETQGAFLQ
jgi:hypothetical protein